MKPTNVPLLTRSATGNSSPTGGPISETERPGLVETANQVGSLLREHTSGKTTASLSLFPVSVSIRNIATDSPNVNNDKLTKVFVCGGRFLRFGGRAR